MVNYTIVKGGMALFAIIFLGIVILPVMADFAYGGVMNWDGITGQAGDTARNMRDTVIAIFRWFLLFLAALVVVWMIWSSARKDPTVEEVDW